MNWSLDADDLCVVYCTVPDMKVAESIARAAVEDGLAACVNVVPGIRSIYRWKGQVCDDAELLLIIKTTWKRVEALGTKVKALHPYEMPEVIALPIVGGAAPYLGWVRSETSC